MQRLYLSPRQRDPRTPFLQAYTIEDLIRIESDRLWNRLGQRFDARLSGSGDAYLLPWITPVTNVDELLAQTQALTDTVQAGAGASGNFTLETVPNGERWTVYSMLIVRDAGDNTWDQVRLSSAATGVVARFNAFQTGQTAYREILNDLVLDPGDAVIVDLEGAGVAATDLTISMWYSKEDAF